MAGQVLAMWERLHGLPGGTRVLGPDVPVRVKAVRADGTTVVEGTIHLWVTDKK